MPLDVLPAEIQLPTREELVAKWKRRHQMRVPEARTGPGTQVDVDARNNTDALLPLYSYARSVGQGATLENARGTALKQWGDRYGVEGPNEAVGSTGLIEVETRAGGADVVYGNELTHEATGLVFYATRTRRYYDGEQVPIAAKDVGPDTNLPAGTILTWSQGIPGMNPNATVAAQPNGEGLSGGRIAESEDDYRARIQREISESAESGNEAEYIAETQNAKQHGVPVQKAFAYSAANGTGTTNIVFTVTTDKLFGSRIPSAVQRADVEAYVVGIMPGDDGAFFLELLEESVDIAFRVTWDENADAWVDRVPWPTYAAVGAGKVVVQSAASSTSFVLRQDDDDYTGAVQPQVGQTIAFFDRDSAKFREKRILSFTGTGPWNITCDTANGASDTTYTPLVDQPAMPWSDSLDDIVAPLATYHDGLGPGEIFSSFYDEGRRQRRQPLPPRQWPHTLTRKGLETVIDIDAILDGEVVEGDGAAPTVGTPGTLARILRLRFLSVFPE